MKVYINNRNLVTWPKAMAEKMANENHEVIFLDNGSDYPPLMDYYSTCKFEVVRLPNMGNRAPWDSGIVMKLDEPYVVTDPDYDLSMVPSDWGEVLLEGMQRFPHINKFGLSFDESKVPPENPAYTMDQFDKYPDGLPQIWNNKIAGGWLGYPCDSSFALQRPHTIAEIGGIRKDRPYTCIHYPWHITLEPTKTPGKMSVLFDAEFYYYMTHCENSSFTWGRMWQVGMITEYEKRNNITNHYRPAGM
jgi:hypothetical protein